MIDWTDSFTIKVILSSLAWAFAMIGVAVLALDYDSGSWQFILFYFTMASLWVAGVYLYCRSRPKVKK